MNTPPRFGAILLAAGRGERYDPLGHNNKLLQTLPDGRLVVAASAQHIFATVSVAVAVVRDEDDAVAHVLRAAGCIVTSCLDAADGMGASLAHAARFVQERFPATQGWLVALGDMPLVQPATMQALLARLESGAGIAVPCFEGRRGHPVAFDARYLADLAQLCANEGGRAILGANPVDYVPVEDRGVVLDIDVPADLNALTISACIPRPS
ncbi:MAG TPA: nucleotidyltransferase family protein [Burkholderiaceae bacterium]